MKCTNRNKMATTLLYMNKNSIIANESNRKKYDRKIQTNSIAVTATATSNDLFPYLLKNDKKQEVTNVRSIDFKVGIIYFVNLITRFLNFTSIFVCQLIIEYKLGWPIIFANVLD